MPEEDINPGEVIAQLQKENEVLRATNFGWQHKWEQSEAYVKDHWIIKVPKVRLGLGNLVGNLMTMDIRELERLYIMVCVFCVVTSAVVDIAARLKEMN